MTLLKGLAGTLAAGLLTLALSVGAQEISSGLRNAVEPGSMEQAIDAPAVNQHRKGQQPLVFAENLSGPVQAVLADMASRAAIIFAGEVIAVRWPTGAPGSPEEAGAGLVEIEFRVDSANRGVTGSTFVLKEWAGLWAGGIERYRLGQRLLMMLHAPNAAGMSSPVDGMDGALPIAGWGVAPGSQDKTTAAGIWTLDLRWLQARVVRGTTAVAAARAVPPRTAVAPQSSKAALSATSWRPITPMAETQGAAPLNVVLASLQRRETRTDGAVEYADGAVE